MTKSLPPKSLVLYADDDRDDIALISDVFGEFSGILDLVTFGHGAELLDYLDALDPLQPHPCLIILDINMPVLNGMETLQRLRATEYWNGVPAVLFSTSMQPHEKAFAQKFDAGFVTKPLNTEQIHLIVDQMLEHCSEEFKKKVNKLRGK